MATNNAQLKIILGSSGCGQNQAEVWHDGLPVDAKFSTFLKTVDIFQNNCAKFAKTTKPNFNDNTFTRVIFYTTNTTTAKTEVKTRGQAPPNTTPYMGQVRSPSPTGLPISNQYYNGSIYSFDNVINNPTNMRELINRIKLLNGNLPNLQLYLFIDTGHNLIQAMNQAMTTNDPFLNVINSQISLADSCGIGKNLYNKHFYTNHLISWWYQRNIVVPPYGIVVPTMSPFPMNLMFHTSLTCTLKDDGADKWASKNITQRWTNSNTVVIEIDNARSRNNITSISNSFYQNKTLDNRSLCYQRKRSGDGFQIWFIHFFAYILSHFGNLEFFCTCINGDAQHVPITHLTLALPALPLPTYTQTREKSFFVTIDWPAFCWAAYCHMNVIFYSQGGDVILFIPDPNGYSVLAV